MGEVYKAYDAHRDRYVALKLLSGALSGDREYLKRFRRESNVAARLRDPHVIPIHDFGEIDGQLFIDMRLVDGATSNDFVYVVDFGIARSMDGQQTSLTITGVTIGTWHYIWPFNPGGSGWQGFLRVRGVSL
jgi:serine/threonine-protein kinase